MGHSLYRPLMPTDSKQGTQFFSPLPRKTKSDRFLIISRYIRKHRTVKRTSLSLPPTPPPPPLSLSLLPSKVCSNPPLCRSNRLMIPSMAPEAISLPSGLCGSKTNKNGWNNNIHRTVITPSMMSSSYTPPYEQHSRVRLN